MDMEDNFTSDEKTRFKPFGVVCKVWVVAFFNNYSLYMYPAVNLCYK